MFGTVGFGHQLLYVQAQCLFFFITEHSLGGSVKCPDHTVFIDCYDGVSRGVDNRIGKRSRLDERVFRFLPNRDVGDKSFEMDFLVDLRGHYAAPIPHPSRTAVLVGNAVLGLEGVAGFQCVAHQCSNAFTIVGLYEIQPVFLPLPMRE